MVRAIAKRWYKAAESVLAVSEDAWTRLGLTTYESTARFMLLSDRPPQDRESRQPLLPHERSRTV